MVKLGLISIGNEVLDGRTVNTNAAFFGQAIHAAGQNVSETRVVPDELEAISQCVRSFIGYDLVIVTGGLGPTEDDLTARAVAYAFQQDYRLNQKAVACVRSQVKARGVAYTKTQARQAMLPAKAKVLNNTWGIAPGFKMIEGKTEFFFMPGVPRECRPMFETYILPKIRGFRGQQKLIRTERWRCFGRREAEIYADIASLVEEYSGTYGLNFDFSSQIPFPLCDLRVEFWRGRDPQKRSANAAAIRRFASQITKKIGSIAYSREPKSLVEVVIDALRNRGATLALAESCTGGMLGQMITAVPGCSDVFLGGGMVYANSAKVHLAKVPRATLRRHGAVSAETAIALAEGIRRELNADYALSLTGVSGPSGGSAAKPVGTIYVGLSSDRGSEFKHLWIKNGLGDRLENRTYASHLALDMLRRNLLENPKGNIANGKHKRRRTKQ